MPLYEYQCDACGLRFERIQKFSDELVSVCPECGGAVRKLVSSPAIQFKGSGWYITDYARKPSGQDPAGSKSDSDGSKSETKPKDSSSTEKKTSSDSSTSTSSSKSSTSSADK